MDMQTHSLSSLFAQLGLGSSDQEINSFIKKHSPLSAATDLHKASFWNPSQSSFLAGSKEEDADWAEVVDQLDVMLR